MAMKPHWADIPSSSIKHGGPILVFAGSGRHGLESSGLSVAGFCRTMKFKFTLCLSAVLLGAALPALAFQEQSVGATPAPSGQPAVQPGSAPAAPADMQLTPDEAPKVPEGTEVRIPGLGKLGVLPKMDFGLELLYGANGNQPAVVDPEDVPTTDDLRIRGTMKHKF
jgi:hypothetical protein